MFIQFIFYIFISRAEILIKILITAISENKIVIIVITILVLLDCLNKQEHIYIYLSEIRKNMFPIKRKLLTEDEYRKEGIRETNKALYELREYCSSPNCNPWKTVLKLKDPIRLLYIITYFHTKVY